MTTVGTRRLPVYWEEACRVLSQQDAALVGLIQTFSGESLEGSGYAFGTLANAIVGQQISVLAAARIWQRLTGLMDRLNPQALLALSEAQLRSAGLSGRKIDYLRDLAEHFNSGEFDAWSLDALDDEAAIQRLLAIRGIGRWTAEMFLIFHLLRPDILPIGDIGLQRAMMRHYGWIYPYPPLQLVPFAQRWRPYRTVAVWFLWRSLDPVLVCY